jgi:hypothetical protein
MQSFLHYQFSSPQILDFIRYSQRAIKYVTVQLQAYSSTFVFVEEELLITVMSNGIDFPV